MSVPVKPRSDFQQDVDAALPSKLPISGTNFASASLGGSSVGDRASTSLSPTGPADSRDFSPRSGDETDDLFMEGIDDGREGFALAASSPILDASGVRADMDPALAPEILAQLYLPTIFADHGPCAIRNLTQHLSTSNPSFGALPQGKQRRLIVKALELRRGVLFEKVGWGRWNQIDGKGPSDEAVFTPETKAHVHHRRNGSLFSSSLKSPVGGLSVPTQHIPGSYPANSSYSSNHEFMFSPALSLAEARGLEDDDADIDPLDLDVDGADSETDEEDWKTLGAQALRARPGPGSTSGSYRESSGLAGSYGSAQRSGPYPIRRKSSAGVYQMKPSSSFIHNYAQSPYYTRPTFPKSSSYIKSSPMSNVRASSFSKAREDRKTVPNTPTRTEIGFFGKQEVPSSQADAIEALVMLSGGYEDLQEHQKSRE